MIYAQHVSPGIRKTMDYIQGPGRDNVPDRARLVGGQGFGFDPKTDEDAKLAVDMMEHNAKLETQASQTKKCVNDALHISLSWARGQRADQDEMLEAGKRFLKELGMENAMALFYRHTDRDHTHINPKTGQPYDRDHMHLGASMIDPKTGLTYDRYQLVYRGQHQAIKWEREKDQVTPTRRHQHDVADAAGGVPDYGRMRKLLQKDGEKIPHRKIDQALAYGGHFGRDMAEHREAFKQYIKDEPERTQEQVKGRSIDPNDRWLMDPVEPTKRPNPRIKDEPEREKGHEPEGRLERPEQVSVRDFFKRDEIDTRTAPTRDYSPQKGQVERGDLQDRTDQTAEGRAYIKQKRERSRGGRER